MKTYQTLVNHFLMLLGKKKHTRLGQKESKLVIINAHFRAYFEQLNHSLNLDFTTTSP